VILGKDQLSAQGGHPYVSGHRDPNATDVYAVEGKEDLAGLDLGLGGHISAGVVVPELGAYVFGLDLGGDR
jgi:hypothetical protein